MQSSRGFTLIELLIVVAIIAILAAIAVPNFLEAQTRAKVSRVKADTRSMVTGLEAYRIDHNLYPISLRAVGQSRTYINGALTTPIAYLTGVFPDVFNISDPDPDNRVIIYWGPDYLSDTQALADRSAQWFAEWPAISDGTSLMRDSLYALLSFSPDQDYDVLDNGWWTAIQEYDPTNGTLSDGDVIRFRD